MYFHVVVCRKKHRINIVDLVVYVITYEGDQGHVQ